jgi:hypothetical protein
MYDMNGSYGVARGVRAKVKLGFMYLYDVAILMAFFMIMILSQEQFPQGQGVQRIIYCILVMALGGYCALPTGTGKNNLFSAITYLKYKQKHFISINRNEIESPYSK